MLRYQCHDLTHHVEYMYINGESMPAFKLELLVRIYKIIGDQIHVFGGR